MPSGRMYLLSLAVSALVRNRLWAQHHLVATRKNSKSSLFSSLRGRGVYTSWEHIFLCLLDSIRTGDTPLHFNDGRGNCPHLSESCRRLCMTSGEDDPVSIPKFAGKITDSRAHDCAQDRVSTPVFSPATSVGANDIPSP